MPKLLLYWVLAALVLVQQERVEAVTSCKLKFEGFGNAKGLRSAQLSCSGGSIKVLPTQRCWPL
jgi:hypothetical protein